MTGGRIAAALLLPPLGVFLVRGLGTAFWIGLGLTVLGYVPGVLYALYVLWSGHSGHSGDVRADTSRAGSSRADTSGSGEGRAVAA